MVVIPVNQSIVAELQRVGLPFKAEALVGHEARVGGVVGAVPVGSAVVAVFPSPAGIADAKGLKKYIRMILIIIVCKLLMYVHIRKIVRIIGIVLTTNVTFFTL